MTADGSQRLQHTRASPGRGPRRGPRGAHADGVEVGSTVAFNAHGWVHNVDVLTTAMAKARGGDVVAVSETWFHEGEPVPEAEA